MSGEPEDWLGVLECLLAGDRLALLKINRLVTGCLVQLRAYDFRDEWDDLRQEVLLALVANARAGKLRDPKAFIGYVRIITRNKFLDRLKGQLRHRAKKSLPWDEETARLATTLGTTGGDDAARAVSTDLWKAVRDLPDQQRRVVHGIYGEGKTYQQVADESGLPLGTMKRRLRDALVTLRQRLAEGTEGS